jgi:hypothetical protein
VVTIDPVFERPPNPPRGLQEKLLKSPLRGLGGLFKGSYAKKVDYPRKMGNYKVG